jgi:hypothetical protein
MKEEEIIQKFKGIDENKLQKLKNHVSFKDGFMEFSDEFKKQVVNDILVELNWNHIYTGYENYGWEEPKNLSSEMGQ